MNLRSVDLNLLVVFDAVFRAGSISVAAQQIGMSQPAASNALARFRAVIGDPLFVRNPFGVTPTEKARQIAPTVRQALTLLETTLQAEVGYDYAKDSTTFLISMEELCELVLIPHLVRWLRQVAPGVNVGISQEMRGVGIDAMRKGKLDMSIEYAGDELPKDFESRVLFEEDRVCVVRQDHSSIGNVLSLQEYLETPHVVLNQRLRGTTALTTYLEDQGWLRNIALEVPSYLSVPTVLIRTDLIATMPRRVATHLAEYYPLKILRLPFSMSKLDFVLKWHTSKTSDPRHEWMRSVIVSLVGR